MPVGLVMFEKK